MKGILVPAFRLHFRLIMLLFTGYFLKSYAISDHENVFKLMMLLPH